MREGYRYWIGIVAMLFLGMMFVVSGTGKLFMQSTSVEYPLFLEFLAPALTQVVYATMPHVEVLIGLLLILGVGVRFATSVAALLITAFVVTNILMVGWGYGAEPCNCFGMNGRLTVVASLSLDIIMAGLAAVIFVCYRGSFFNFTPLILTTGHKAESVPSLGAPEA